MRYHAAIAPQDIPKAHGCEDAIGIMIHALDHHLSHALCRPHHTRRIHRLIGGNEDNPSDAVTCCGFCHYLGPQDIVFDGFAGTHLHEWHMLMRGSMEDDRRSMFGHNRVHPVRISGIAYDGMQRASKLWECL